MDWAVVFYKLTISVDINNGHRSNLFTLFKRNKTNPRSCEVEHVLWDCLFGCKLCRIGCTWKASPQCALPCVPAKYQKKCKRSCIGYTCLAFLLNVGSSCELSNCQLEHWKTRKLCICEVFLQSGSFCVASDCLCELKHSRIDCIYMVSLQYVP